MSYFYFYSRNSIWSKYVWYHLFSRRYLSDRYLLQLMFTVPEQYWTLPQLVAKGQLIFFTWQDLLLLAGFCTVNSPCDAQESI